ncbi:hypothetical protein [Microbacterium sp. NIBRBAC000506063]|uniref:hypothetical protein n=1 Tax=Microbacterium sp. NIBRBAC000506063 TaxID=2734618 RepID=UPI001BB70955|nr:hypothetical protein [Microbacterium sp. NIBRBAC000506063]QTV80518.1 hypothetical protein KAE78_06435 [Microbacterium sp. NIBRBAC000506063]
MDDPADTPLGVHTVTLTGAESGEVSVQFRVVAEELSATGGELGPWGLLGALLLALGASTLVVTRLRRRPEVS